MTDVSGERGRESFLGALLGPVALTGVQAEKAVNLIWGSFRSCDLDRCPS